MYTIAEAARRAGVSVPLLRAWERRYGIVSPERTASGYRLYDDEAVARVRAIRRLVEDGWSPSAASAEVRTHGIPATLAGDSPPEGEAEAKASARGTDDQLIDAFIDAAARMDQDDTAAVLDEMFARGSFERVADDLLMPALERLGDAWASGRVSVAAEHAASHAVLRRLAAAFEAAGTNGEGRGAVIVGLPPGAHHELGALAFAVAARRVGLPVLYLGPDLPVDDWVRAAGGQRDAGRARAAVIGVVSAADRATADEVAEALRAARSDIVVAFGGRSAPERDGVVRLPDGLAAAVDALRERLGAHPVRGARQDIRP